MHLEDKEILTDCLIDAKFFSHGYHMAALESAHDQVRNAFIRMMNDEITGAKMIFDALHQRGWYPVEMAHPAGPQPYYTVGQPSAYARPGEAQPYYGPTTPGMRPEYGTTPGMRPEQPPGYRPEYHPRPETGYRAEGSYRPEGEGHWR